MMLKLSKLFAATNTNSECKDSETPISKTAKIAEQALDSAIVGGISWISQLVVTDGNYSPIGFLIGFGLTFLIKMKEYRKIA
jgi:hypothetical protein